MATVNSQPKQKIVTHLWFDNNAEEAIKLYTSLFPNSRITSEMRVQPGMAGMAGNPGDLFTATFELDGQEFFALNGGPTFKFTEAISLYVNVTSQEELDYYWNALIADGGQESNCGWLKDKFGLSWQIVPVQLGEYMSDPDPAAAGRTMQAMLEMHKLDIAKLQRAHDNK